ncbi:MAG: histidine kinase, partial [Pseudomonadota bacterium]|nr:histidine kinase [Pseudomonadota bacterium]
MSQLFIQHFSLPLRAALLATLGLTAWAVAFSRILMDNSPAENQYAYLLYGLAIANGCALLINTGMQVNSLIRAGLKWKIRNSDPVNWVCLLIAYSSTLAIQAIWQPDTMDQFLLSFLIVIHSIHTIRFHFILSVAALLSASTLYGLQVGGMEGFFVTLYVSNQQLVLWGLGLGVLRELIEANKSSLQAQQLRQVQEQLAEVSRREERSQIRHDLHDKLGHKLAAVHMSLQLLEDKIGEIGKGPEQRLLRSAQDASADLYSTLNSIVGELQEKIEYDFYDRLMEMTNKLSGLEISITTTGFTDFSNLSLKDDLLCAVQEALTNIMKHSTVREAQINIMRNSKELTITVADP